MKSICDRSGRFTCQGRWDKAWCLYSPPHNINPYTSREARIIFQTWNLDHRKERSRAIIPTVRNTLLAVANHDIKNGKKCEDIDSDNNLDKVCIDVKSIYNDLFTISNLKIVHIVCHDKGAHSSFKGRLYLLRSGETTEPNFFTTIVLNSNHKRVQVKYQVNIGKLTVTSRCCLTSNLCVFDIGAVGGHYSFVNTGPEYLELGHESRKQQKDSMKTLNQKDSCMAQASLISDRSYSLSYCLESHSSGNDSSIAFTPLFDFEHEPPSPLLFGFSKYSFTVPITNCDVDIKIYRQLSNRNANQSISHSSFVSYPIIFSSKVALVINLYTLTTFRCPIRWALSIACRSFIGFQSCSTNITVSAPVKFSPSPPT
ncbi:hypothetical protein NQ318_016979 [Aromia moschata]|uniref:DNA fragmentation factor 40 C-terminal domain-containing protein n=1 Tax=Aromia moschata TaxID=1265417 RepID=A0AAV8YD37_9CUCU|nr:hypothetical protein NQ318_016979 [Aromia moschata]